MREPGDEIGKLALPPTYLPQLLDQPGALPVGFFEQPAEGKRQTTRTIFGCCLGKIRNRG